MKHINERLTLAYWNTGLSPIRGKNAQRYTKKKPFVKRILEALVQEGVDFLAIAEVDKGYPVKISWSDRQDNCGDRQALTETLQELLADPQTGKIFLHLLNEQPVGA